MNESTKGHKTNDVKLTSKQLKTISELVANGGNKEATAKKMHIAKQTIYDWLSNPDFFNEYKAACEQVYNEALSKAVNKITELLDCNDSRTQLKSAETILKLNGYLSTKLDVTENTSENIIISILNDDSDS